jgi:penicillin amidase
MEIQKDRVRVKGRSEPVEIELQYTRHGPVVAVAPDKHIAFALRWAGSEPGSAAYLGGLGIDRAQNWAEFRDGLKRWKIPGENFVYADVDGNIGYQAAALTPIRQNWPGLLPVPGWTGEYEWSGWYTLDDLPHEANPKRNFIATANHNTLPPGEKRVIGYDWSDPARFNRIRDVLTSKEKFDIEDFERLQHDSVAWNAGQLISVLSRLTAADAETERARKVLVDWDRNVSKDSGAAALYVLWEQELRKQLARGKVPEPLGEDYRAGAVLVPVLTAPSADWFGANPASARDKLMVSALTAALTELKAKLGSDPNQWAWGRLHTATFRHALASDAETQTLFNVGPFPRAGYALTPFNTGGRGFEQNSGSSYRQVIDVAAWDRSIATSAPGQSGQPTSPHFDDVAKLWAEHKYFPLSFTQSAVHGNAEATLTLVPRRPTK